MARLWGMILLSCGFLTELQAANNSNNVLQKDVHQIWVKGNQLLEEGKYEQAIENYDKVLADRPDFFDAWYGKGLAIKLSGDKEGSLACFDEVLKLKPDHVPSLNARGNTHIQLGRYQEAFKDLQKAIEIDDQYFPAHYNLGAAWLFTDEFKKALIHYQFAVRINPKPQELWYRIGCVFSELGRQEDALEALEKALQLKPVYESFGTDIWFQKGFSLHALRRYTEAEDCYLQVLKLDEKYAVAYYNLACVYAMQGRWNESFESLKRHYEISSDDPSEVYTDDELKGLIEHPIYSRKIKDLVAKHSGVNK